MISSIGRSATAFLWIAAALPGVAAQAQSATILVEDGEFSGWATEARIPGQMVSGTAEPSGGVPGAHYLVTHLHRLGDPFSSQVPSQSFFSGEFDFSSFSPEDLLVVTIDHRAEEDESSSGFETEVSWLPLLRQGGTVLGSPAEDLQPIAFEGVFSSSTLAVPLGSFRPLPDLASGAPAVEVGFLLQSIKAVGTEPREVRIHVDNFHARAGPPDPPGLDLNVTDRGHSWNLDPLIRYELTVDNGGPEAIDLAISEIVPVNTVFVAAESTPGWQCTPGPDEGSHCLLPLGNLPTGAREEAIFAVRVRAGTPEAFDVWHDAGFGSTRAAAAEAFRPKTPKAETCELIDTTEKTGSCSLNDFTRHFVGNLNPPRDCRVRQASRGKGCCPFLNQRSCFKVACQLVCGCS